MASPEYSLATVNERTMLESWLDLARDAVVAKIDGLSEVDLRRRLVPSLTTVGGVVKHLRWVETGWFHQLLGAHSGDSRRTHDRDWEFTVQPEDTCASLVEAYREACAGSRFAARGYELDDVVPHQEMGGVSVRWIFVHLIEETNRHAGQLDILREQLDAGRPA